MKKLCCWFTCVLLLQSPVVHAAVTLYYTSEAGSHCYDIVTNNDMPVKSITLGSTWDGHPIPDSVELEVVELPAGWSHDIVVRKRYEFQYVELKAGKHEAMAGHSVGKVCIRLSENVRGLENIPFAYEQEGSPRRIGSNAIIE